MTDGPCFEVFDLQYHTLNMEMHMALPLKLSIWQSVSDFHRMIGMNKLSINLPVDAAL
jgi:hypothetical protein